MPATSFQPLLIYHHNNCTGIVFVFQLQSYLYYVLQLDFIWLFCLWKPGNNFYATLHMNGHESFRFSATHSIENVAF